MSPTTRTLMRDDRSGSCQAFTAVWICACRRENKNSCPSAPRFRQIVRGFLDERVAAQDVRGERTIRDAFGESPAPSGTRALTEEGLGLAGRVFHTGLLALTLVCGGDESRALERRRRDRLFVVVGHHESVCA